MGVWIKHHRKLLVCVCIVIITGGILYGAWMFPAFEEAQFSEVISYVNNDPRNPTPITYAAPNFTDETGWNIGLHKWSQTGLIDWNQVELFLTQLEFYNSTVYWCDYYRAHPDEPPWRLFLWFQTGEYEYEFLFASGI